MALPRQSLQPSAFGTTRSGPDDALRRSASFSPAPASNVAAADVGGLVWTLRRRTTPRAMWMIIKGKGLREKQFVRIMKTKGEQETEVYSCWL